MPHIQQPETSITLEEVTQLFKEWRQTREHKTRIPDELWASAATLSNHFKLGEIPISEIKFDTKSRDDILQLFVVSGRFFVNRLVIFA